MRLILHYLSGMLGYMLFLLPFYLLGRSIYLKKTKKEFNLPHETILLLFILYMIGLASQTIMPKWDMGIYSDTGEFYFNIQVGIDLTRVNLVPFQTLKNYLFTTSAMVDDWESVSLLNLVANVFLLSPIGLFFPLLSNRWHSFKKILLIGLITTISIEFIQLFISRSVDIDDVILNTIGVIIGYGVFLSIFKLSKSKVFTHPIESKNNE